MFIWISTFLVLLVNAAQLASGGIAGSDTRDTKAVFQLFAILFFGSTAVDMLRGRPRVDP